MASQNRDQLKSFRQSAKSTIIKISGDEQSAIITFKDGRKQKTEFPYGSSFLSQSSRFLNASSSMKKIEIRNTSGKLRRIDL
jgi:hypothetical protein